MPVACLLDLKERTESKDEGARGSAANEVRRKTKSPHPDQMEFCDFFGEDEDSLRLASARFRFS